MGGCDSGSTSPGSDGDDNSNGDNDGNGDDTGTDNKTGGDEGDGSIPCSLGDPNCANGGGQGDGNGNDGGIPVDLNSGGAICNMATGDCEQKVKKTEPPTVAPTLSPAPSPPPSTPVTSSEPTSAPNSEPVTPSPTAITPVPTQPPYERCPLTGCIEEVAIVQQKTPYTSENRVSVLGDGRGGMGGMSHPGGRRLVKGEKPER